MKRWQFWVGVLVSAFFLVLALRGLELEKVGASLKQGRYLWLVPGVVVYFGAVGARTWRWHYLLRTLKPIPLRTLFPVVTIGYMGNNIYPARAGEVLRAYVLKQREGISVSASLATILVERIFDGLVMLLFVFLALPTVPELPVRLRQLVIIASGLFLGALLLFFAMAATPQRVQRLSTRLLIPYLPARFRQPVQGLLERFLTGLSSLRSGRDVAMIFFTSVVIWLLETLKYWFVMHAFPFQVSFFALMLMNGVVNLATTLPSGPGYVGTFDTPGIAVLQVFGVERSLATGYTLVLHVALWFPITLLGAIYMVRESLSWKQVQAEMAREGVP